VPDGLGFLQKKYKILFDYFSLFGKAKAVKRGKRATESYVWSL